MTDQFIGFFDLNATMHAAVPITDGAQVPVDPASAPTFRVYDGSSFLVGGVLSQLDTGTITGASNATPIVITSAAHGLATGNVVKITGVGGNSAANGTFSITVLDPNTFALTGSAGNGPYTAGGVWHTAGLYQLGQALSASYGFASGSTYQVLVNWNDGSANRCKSLSFGVL